MERLWSASGFLRREKVSGEYPIGSGDLGGEVCSIVLKDPSESSEPAGLASEGKSSSSMEG